MKNKINYILLFTLVFLTMFTSCKKYAGDSYDFSNTQKNYVRFASIANLSFNPDGKLAARNITFQSRVAYTENINIAYSINIEGQQDKKQLTTILPWGTTGVAVPITIPASYFSDSQNTLSGTIKIESASGVNYGDLRVGYPNQGDASVIKFTAKKPQ